MRWKLRYFLSDFKNAHLTLVENAPKKFWAKKKLFFWDFFWTPLAIFEVKKFLSFRNDKEYIFKNLKVKISRHHSIFRNWVFHKQILDFLGFSKNYENHWFLL